MKNVLFASLAATVILAGCAARPPAVSNDAATPPGMHRMPNGEMMMDHGMPGTHEMPDGTMMADGQTTCCTQGPGGMKCAMMGGSMDHGSMAGMDHDDMTMGDMVAMLEGKTGDALDAAFLEGMIPHHQGAIDMAEFLLENAKHDELKQMARDIIDAQQREIDMMKAWQREWGYVR